MTKLKSIYLCLGIILMLGALEVKAATIQSICKDSSQNCPAKQRKFLRYKAKKGLVTNTYNLAVFLGNNPVGDLNSIGDVPNLQTIMQEALEALNIPESSLNLQLGSVSEINSVQEALDGILKRSIKNKKSVIVIDNSANSDLFKAFFNSQVTNTGVGGALSATGSGKIVSSFLIMPGARFLGAEADANKALYTAMHELIHSLGGSHAQTDDGDFSAGSEAANNPDLPLMYPKFLGNDARLTNDDKALLQFMYPNKKDKGNKLTTKERLGLLEVTLLNNGQPVTGYMVIAYDANDASVAIGAHTGFRSSDGKALIPVPIDPAQNSRQVILRITPTGPDFTGGSAISLFEEPNTVLGISGYFNGDSLINNDAPAISLPLVAPENQITVNTGLKKKEITRITIDLANLI